MSDHRVEIQFERRFSRKSENGKSFGWLKQNLGTAYGDAIANVVRFMFLPIALAEAGASRDQVEAEINKAREFFNAKMIAALGSCHEAADSNGSSPVLPSSISQSGMFAGMGKPAASNGASTASPAAVDPDDDFLELDEDKLMEG